MAALFALPQAARAHQGHAHTHAQHVHAHASPEAVANTDAGVPQAAAKPRAEQDLTATAQSLPAKSGGMPCSDFGCCVHSSCGACASVVAPATPLMLPPTARVEVSDIANFNRSGIDGPSLRRPPRSFA